MSDASVFEALRSAHSAQHFQRRGRHHLLCFEETGEGNRDARSESGKGSQRDGRADHPQILRQDPRYNKKSGQYLKGDRFDDRAISSEKV